APTLSALAQLGLSRTREYDADLQAARLSGDPEGLARALIKIERMQGGWIERLFMPRRKTFLASLLRTHPTTEERVKRLMTLPLADPLYQSLPVPSMPADIPPLRRRLLWWIRGPWL
ncbi:MAG TPA: peptidase M48, partial [Halothiobacillus sp.]|nr:peptidase M48 [Halothiobacillus sp.]